MTWTEIDAKGSSCYNFVECLRIIIIIIIIAEEPL